MPHNAVNALHAATDKPTIHADPAVRPAIGVGARQCKH